MNVHPYKNTEFKALIKEVVTLFSPVYCRYTYLELGTKNGYIFNEISPLVHLAVGVDINGFKHVAERSNTKLFCTSTNEFFITWKMLHPDIAFDLIFIDADHRKEQVLKDFNNALSVSRKGSGLILLHDTHPMLPSLMAEGYCSNAYEAAWEIRQEAHVKGYEMLTLPGPWAGLSIVRNSSIQLGWKLDV
jgi:hypothetical protein